MPLRAEARDGGVILAEGQPAPSPPARGLYSCLILVNSPAGSGAKARPPKHFVVFYRRQMVFPVISKASSHAQTTNYFTACR